MKRISLLLTFVFILASSVALSAEEPKEGNGNQGDVQKESKEQSGQVRTRTVRARDTKTAKKAASPDEKVLVVTKDPKTGEMIKRKISTKELDKMKAKSQDQEDKTAKIEKAAKEEKKAVGEKAGKSKADIKSKSEEMEAKGKGREQKAVALQKQMVHEDQKHQTRRVRLERMLQVAKDKGDDKAVGRIEKLMTKEQSRYDKKHQKMMGRGEKEKKGKDQKEKSDKDEKDKNEDED